MNKTIPIAPAIPPDQPRELGALELLGAKHQAPPTSPAQPDEGIPWGTVAVAGVLAGLGVGLAYALSKGRDRDLRARQAHREAFHEPYAVYRGVNHTLGEVYFGIAKDPERRWRKHATGRTVALSHWDHRDDKITWGVESIHRGQMSASVRAHSREQRFTSRSGRIAIRTGGK